MKIIIKDNYNEMSKEGALLLKRKILEKPSIVLGLASGSTTPGLYRELIAMYKTGELSFSEITSFNLDEYLGLSSDDPNSYHFYMQKNLFSEIDIAKENIFIPDGSAKDLTEYCGWYGRKIKEAGGIDLQVLGIGRNGHIGFNEPGTSFDSQTRSVNLTEQTIADNAKFFESHAQVPKQALTMGIATIMSAKQIVLLAFGKEKAKIIKQALQGPVTPQVPASVLQNHPDFTVILDKPAASLLN